MGCFGSRDSHRQQVFGSDFTLVPYGFRKGELKNADAFAPVDKLVAAFIGAEKEAAESKLGEFKDLNFSKADELKQVATQIFDLIISSAVCRILSYSPLIIQVRYLQVPHRQESALITQSLAKIVIMYWQLKMK